MVVVELEDGDATGVGYTYADASVAKLIESKLAPIVRGTPVDVFAKMCAALRNEGLRGSSMMAVSAVDIALWDLRARTLGTSVLDLLGASRDRVDVYGSGGFTSYSPERVGEQLGAWADDGIRHVKMKVGREPSEDPARLDAARKAIGEDVDLFVDANGAFQPKAALEWAHRYRSEWNVSWFEEPVVADDLDGLRLVRERGPSGLDIAGGEYGFVPDDFVRLLPVLDCLQADVTRCGGFTGFARVDALCNAHSRELSGHCAPAVSAHALAAASSTRHLEYFHDHVRIEEMFFDGLPKLQDGSLVIDTSRPGHGLTFKRADAEKFRV
jgi:L-alanine-DL-glutamate epimerase-like enolase superfamily enzyme